MDDVVASRVTRAIDYLVDEGARGGVRRVQGHDDEWRLRVGSWRVRFTANFEERTKPYFVSFIEGPPTAIKYEIKSEIYGPKKHPFGRLGTYIIEICSMPSGG